MADQDYSVSQLARLAGVSRQSVQRAIDRGRLPSAYKAGKIWIIPKAEGDAYIKIQASK